MSLHDNIQWVKDINDIHPRYPEKGVQALKHVFYKDGTDQKYSFEEWNVIVEEGENEFEKEQALIEKMRNIKNE
tara:strand:+ start:280 stop:501 length:222 start_codon:yes stop_codon:yes gene_type:complete